MNKKRLTFLISSIIISIVITISFLAGSSLSSTTGKAKGTAVVQPGSPVNNSTCLSSCHATVKMLSSRGGHKNVNCASCHEIAPDHAANPSEKNRPKTQFDHEACGQCHANEFKSMMSNKLHLQWAEKNPNLSYYLWRYSDSGTFSRVQGKIPRFHASLLSDVAVNKTWGRFKYKDGLYGYGKVGGKLWDNVYDAYPEDGNLIKSHEEDVAFRPHKGRGVHLSTAMCLSCKTGEQILNWPYMGKPHEKARFNRSTEPLDLLKSVNYSLTCNMCHDPHSAEPRIIRDSFIRALTDPEFSDNVYQSSLNKTKVEVIDMGERGFVHKIAILEKYDSKLQCGQCHCASDSTGQYSVATGKYISARAVDGMNINPMMGPFEYVDFYNKRGWYNGGKHPDTGALIIFAQHPNAEIVFNSTHDKAGVGCTDCHYAKEVDGKTKKTYKAHQASLPLYKIEQTCLNAGCHGKGSKQNWTKKEALYYIKMIQQLQRQHLAELEFNLNKIVAGIMIAQNIGIDKAVLEKAKAAHTRTNAILTYWVNDYSNGMHNPELSEKSLMKAIQESKASYADLNKALKAKGTTK